MMNFRHPSTQGAEPHANGLDDEGEGRMADATRGDAPDAGDAAPPAQDTLTIREMCDRFAVTARTLRFYEASGLLAPMRHGTRRHYGPADCTRLSLILRSKRLGFTLEDIREILALYEAEGEAAARRERITALGAGRLAAMERQQHDIGLAIADLGRLLDEGGVAMEAHLRADEAA